MLALIAAGATNAAGFRRREFTVVSCLERGLLRSIRPVLWHSRVTAR